VIGRGEEKEEDGGDVNVDGEKEPRRSRDYENR